MGLASLGFSSIAHADWDWTAADGCLDAARARMLVERTLDATLDDGIAVSARIEGNSRAWHASIVVTGRDGVARTRDLESEERACLALDDAVALVTALLIDEASGSMSPSVLAIAPPRVLEPLPVPDVAAPVEHEVSPTAEPHWIASIRIDALARVDELPGFTGAPVLAIEVTPPGAIPVLLSIGPWPPMDALVEMRGGRFYGAFASLGACPAAPVDPAIELGGCGALAATYVIADGVGVAVPQHAEGLVLSVEATFFGRVHVAGPLWLRASLGALVPLTRPRATIDVADAQVVVHEVAPVVPEGTFGAELHFP